MDLDLCAEDACSSSGDSDSDDGADGIISLNAEEGNVDVGETIDTHARKPGDAGFRMFLHLKKMRQKRGGISKRERDYLAEREQMTSRWFGFRQVACVAAQPPTPDLTHQRGRCVCVGGITEERKDIFFTLRNVRGE